LKDSGRYGASRRTRDGRDEIRKRRIDVDALVELIRLEVHPRQILDGLPVDDAIRSSWLN